MGREKMTEQEQSHKEKGKEERLLKKAKRKELLNRLFGFSFLLSLFNFALTFCFLGSIIVVDKGFDLIFYSISCSSAPRNGLDVESRVLKY